MVLPSSRPMTDLIKIAGSDGFEFLVWIIIVAFWGVGKLLSSMAKDRSAEKPQKAPQKKSTFEPLVLYDKPETTQATPTPFYPIDFEIETPTEAPTTPIPPTPRKKQPPKKAIVKENSQNLGCRPIPPSAVFKSATSSIKQTRSMTPRLPTNTGIKNPLRPTWKNKQDIRKAIIASIILEPVLDK